MKNKKKIYKVSLYEVGSEYFYKGKITKIGEIAVFKSIIGVTEISTCAFITAISKKDINDSILYYPVKNNDVKRDLFVLREDLTKDNIMSIEEINDYYNYEGSKNFTDLINAREEREGNYELSCCSEKQFSKKREGFK